MFFGKRSNKEVNRGHKRASHDYDASFKKLLERINEKPIFVTKLQNLMIERYKSFNCQNPMFMRDMFKRRETTYDFLVKDLLQLRNMKTTYGI